MCLGHITEVSQTIQMGIIIRDSFHGELLHMQGPETVYMVNFYTCKAMNEESIPARVLVLFDVCNSYFCTD